MPNRQHWHERRSQTHNSSQMLELNAQANLTYAVVTACIDCRIFQGCFEQLGGSRRHVKVQHLAARALRQRRGEEVVVSVQVGAGGAALEQLGHAGVHAAVLDQLLHDELVHLRPTTARASAP